jgi:hypothetical protein
MIRLYATLFAFIGATATGCSDVTRLKDEPVGISGKVSQAGKPVGNVVVWFHPLDNGHVENLPVNADGTFMGQLIAGNYSYYVGSSLAQNSMAALKKIDPKYHQPDFARSVAVEFGKEIVLALD